MIVLGWMFYLIASPGSLPFLVGVTVFTYMVGLGLEKKRSKFLLCVGTGVLLALLIFFKYGYVVFGTDPLMPLGLSYYTFMTIGYMIDVYRGDIEAEKDLINYFLFVGFFPQVTAGPIGRAKDLLLQYEKKIKPSPEDMMLGFTMIITGVMQKFIVADNIRLFSDGFLGGDTETFSVICGTICYSLVIYFDFAGYSLIAIGTARVFGIKLMENFKEPFFATSIKDFWRRWHISLSSWFRDYLYIPLGGNKKGVLRRDINTLIVFILSGAWHGSGAGFYIWGLLHGIYLVAENHINIFKDKTNEEKGVKKHLKRLVVFIMVSFAWIPFYAGSFERTGDILGALIRPDTGIFFNIIRQCMDVGAATLIVTFICLLISVVISVYQVRSDHMLYEKISKHGVCVLFMAVSVFILTVLAGVYGSGYDASVFIYGGF